MTDSELTAALAAADQQFLLVTESLADTIADASELLTEHDGTEAWAILSVRIGKRLKLDSQHHRFAGEMVAAAAVALATASTDSSAPPGGPSDNDSDG